MSPQLPSTGCDQSARQEGLGVTVEEGSLAPVKVLNLPTATGISEMSLDLESQP